MGEGEIKGDRGNSKEQTCKEANFSKSVVGANEFVIRKPLCCIFTAFHSFFKVT